MAPLPLRGLSARGVSVMWRSAALAHWEHGREAESGSAMRRVQEAHVVARHDGGLGLPEAADGRLPVLAVPA